MTTQARQLPLLKSQARLGVRAFQSCHGGCQLFWVLTVEGSVLLVTDLPIGNSTTTKPPH